MFDKQAGEVSLIKAKPGAGKSNAIMQVLKARIQEHKDHVYMIASPFTVQVQQASSNYDVIGYIDGVKINIHERPNH